MAPLLWPPCGPGSSLSSSDPLRLSAQHGLRLYAADQACQQAIEAVAFTQWAQAFGLPASLVPRPTGAQIQLYIDNTTCAKAEGFELQVRSEEIILVGADFAGLVYGLYRIKQLLDSNSKIWFDGDIKHLELPGLVLSDSPSLPKRAIRCSYQYHVLHPKSNPVALVRWLSELQINFLLLDLDCDEIDVSSIVELDEACSKLAITFIPFISRFGTSSNKILDLVQQAHCKSIFLHLIDSEQVLCAEKQLRDLQFHTIYVCREGSAINSSFVHATAQLIEIPTQDLHANVDDKPLAATRAFYDHLLQQFGDSVKHELAIFSIHTERDFLTPDLLIKVILSYMQVHSNSFQLFLPVLLRYFRRCLLSRTSS
jgi:hypothetical protein